MHIFLGDFTSSNSDRWPFDANHVGTFTVLGDSDDTGCEKCQTDQAANLQVTGQVPLTIALLERFLAGIIASLSEDAIVPYLKEKLHWRVTLGDGSERPRGDVDDLTVSVISNEVPFLLPWRSCQTMRLGWRFIRLSPPRNLGWAGEGMGLVLRRVGLSRVAMYDRAVHRDICLRRLVPVDLGYYEPMKSPRSKTRMALDMEAARRTE